MKRRHWIWLLIALMLALSLACGGSSDDEPPPTATPTHTPTQAPPGPTSTPEPTPLPPTSTPRSAQPPDGETNTVAFTFQNFSGKTVCYLRISPSSSDTWGDDWLGQQATMPDGTSRVFRLAPGMYDLRAEDCDLNVVYEEMDISVSGDTTVTAGGRGTVESTLTVINQLDTAICYVYISPASSNQWGDDRLNGEETIVPGASRIFHLPDGTYDLMGLDCDSNRVMERYNFVLQGTLTLTASPPPEETITLQLQNNLRDSVCYVFISPTGTEGWGPDRLGNEEVIPPGGNRLFEVKVGTYDLMAQDCNRAIVSEIRVVALNENSTWTIEEEGAPELVINFVADRYRIRQGECATLSWRVENASRVVYNGTDVNSQGSSLECPATSTRYELYVEDLADGWETRYIDIVVETGY